tara:strand:- start:3479 stop:3595 length:117 start_codon:yes stop_codon:yes gene_type:complete
MSDITKNNPPKKADEGRKNKPIWKKIHPMGLALIGFEI